MRSVSETRIFARLGERGKQVIVYAMRLDAPHDLAMILPIPVTPRSAENAVDFISLKSYPNLFEHLEAGFPRPLTRSRSSESDSFGVTGKAPLKVETVGSFEASFVPVVADFSRLDPRFRLPEKAWDALPQYADWGFVVFKLRKGEAQVHPMAFAFPTRDPSRLFFPTVHIHDGKVHAAANFDHTLYCQSSRPARDLRLWHESQQPARNFVNIPFSKALVRPDLHVLRRVLRGRLKNEDLYLPLLVA